jgi:hypothetical protein
MPSGTLDMLSVWPAGRRSHEYNSTAQSDISQSHQRTSSDGPTRLLSLPHPSHSRGDSAHSTTSAAMSSLAPPQTTTSASSVSKGHMPPAKVSMKLNVTCQSGVEVLRANIPTTFCNRPQSHGPRLTTNSLLAKCRDPRMYYRCLTAVPSLLDRQQR